MDFLNDEIPGNDAGDSNKEFGTALKQNASYVLRWETGHVLPSGLYKVNDCVSFREIATATPYTLKRLAEVSDDRDSKRVDTKGEGKDSSPG